MPLSYQNIKEGIKNGWALKAGCSLIIGLVAASIANEDTTDPNSPDAMALQAGIGIGSFLGAFTLLTCVYLYDNRNREPAALSQIVISSTPTSIGSVSGDSSVSLSRASFVGRVEHGLTTNSHGLTQL